MGPAGPPIIFDWSTRLLPPSPDGDGAPVIVAGERRLLEGVRMQGWIRGVGAVLLVVMWSTEVEERDDDEPRGGRRPRWVWGFRPMVVPELV